MSVTNWKKLLKDKSERQQVFLSRKDPGNLLVYLRGGAPGPQKSIMSDVYSLVLDNRSGHFPDRNDIQHIIANHVREFREARTADTLVLFDDSVPIISLHFDIGIQTAAMTDMEPWYAGEVWWLEPRLEWEQIEELKFNPDNKWVQLLNDINWALWNVWEEDFLFLPFLHRSPLDAANGIRGNELFLEMYTDPDKVKWLVEWCVQCELHIETFIHENSGRPGGCPNGHMSTWLPERAVWINGDPVGLISREMMREFEQPYTAKLFTSTGGGFFHNHTRGIYQVDQVAETEGILIEQFSPDPKFPTVAEVLRNDPVQRDVILQASLNTPIYVSGISADELEKTLPILKEGRFILNVATHKDKRDLNVLLQKVREASNLF